MKRNQKILDTIELLASISGFVEPDGIELFMKVIEVMSCSDKLVDITVVGERCVYINNTRVAGGKPYFSENIPQHSFEVKASVIIDAL